MARILTRLARAGVMTWGHAWNLPLRVVMQAWQLERKRG